MSLPILHLKPNEERRLRAGHLWIYSNEIDTVRSGLKQLEPGALCQLQDARGHALGVAYVNPRALLAARLLSTRVDAQIDADWFAQRIGQALAWRERIYPEPYYRLLYGEADGVPGLVVDRFANVLVAQFSTAGIDTRGAAVLEALQRVVQPRGIWLANDLPAREPEGLARTTTAIGDVPEQVDLREGGLGFAVSVRRGQKTGWFFDQRDNRDRLTRYARGARMLDVFSYAGGWALRALAAGAASATCIDSSAPALEAATGNAERNGLAIEALRGDALDVLRALHAESRRFDLIVVDPPALIKRRKDHGPGFEHYVQLNRAAIDLLAPGGMLIACSCSFHLAAEELQLALLRASRAAGRRLQILEQGGQGADHPIHPAIPETRYLKVFFCRVG